VFEKLNLNNFKIRTKLVAVLFLPVVALLFFAGIGYGERNTTADRATTDEHIVAAAASTARLVAAMQHEMVATVDQIATKNTDGGVAKIRSATDKAVEDFDQANRRLDLSGGASDTSDAASAFETLEATLSSFKGYRSQPSDVWSDQLESYRSASINHFVDYVQSLAGLTSTPEVVVPLEQLASLLDYNLQTTALSTMAITTQPAGADQWTIGDPSNRTLVYDQAGEQDKANAVLTRVAPGSTSIKTYFNQSVKIPTALDTVLNVDWQTQQAMSGTSFEATPDSLEFPGQPVSLEDVQTYVNQLAGAATDLTDRTSAQIEADRKDAVRASRLYAVGGFLVVALAIAGAIWISRSITQRLNRLTGAADRLSHEQLPRLVDSLKNPAEDDVSYLTSSFAEIDVGGSDEIGRLAGAFNRIQGVAVEVATEQAQLLRKGIGDMFVNLARRNQGLLDRQIEFIDQLESAEEDPDQLENLFRLDHLATRMRRNAESLLVLAGAEPSRRRGKPVPLADVVRAAVGEVEDFARIDMLQFDEVLVASNAALDIAHLLSELMENATNFSPPDTRVEVVGHRTKAEGYVISVTDHGIGMAPDALAESNDLLARPPLVGLALSRSLGFIVIGRLAARFGIAVRLMPSPSSGTTAMVSLPPSLITDQPRTSSEPAALANRDRPAAPPAPDRDPAALAAATDRRPPPRPTKPPSAQAAPQNAGSDRPSRPSPAPPPPSSVPRRGTTTAPKPAPATDGAAPADTAPAPVATSSGLTKRVPRAAGGQRAVPGGDGERSATQNRRSPDEVRSMLSRYRSGMQKGRDTDDQTTPDGQTPQEGGQ
jgi:signal transduction histidine kinase